MFSDTLFKRLAEDQPNFTEKVVVIVGDCYDPNLGLSAEDEELLVANIHVVIHCAATITFNGPLKRACFINVRSTRDLLLMAQRMPNLKSFVYVSTAFSNPNESLIKEIIYNCHIKAETLIDIVENLPESIVTSITPQIIGKWPNTYTLSKAVAENLIKDYGKNMPISISRPCVDVVIHCAATISFNGPLKRACFINVRSTRDLLLMAQRMPNLKSFVYVSTAFSNPNESLIKEIIYNCHIKAETLIDIVENLPESIVTSITPQIIGKWPNTYTLSKAVAENLIKDYGKNMPISISRPCVGNNIDIIDV
ncbi:Male sterility, NAD-binding,NAD(P)-binding domain [Cinara cedri]|uniref:Fatty acyl-CoA reductase n=1 Tax=Cinara cedri TaxID=506608 RepID=A0A5E4NKL7_9HEMI|nr:Male sterility, NAD-binding,NAD(P)-binding domain [Cinara cedri]